VLVISDRREALALQKAVEAQVEAEYVPWPKSRAQGAAYKTAREQFEQVAGRLLQDHRIDLVLLAGFMRLLSPEFVQAWQGRILNIHPSLLPQFPGLHAQRQALEAGVSESGCTVHFVDAGTDTGPIVLQRRVPVLPDDTEETLAARILEQEHQAYPEAVRQVLKGTVSYPSQSPIKP
jgi:phosphoribosylglycinamide formyltransferase-1